MLTGFVIGDRGLGTSGDTHPAWMIAHAEAGPYLVIGASAAGQLHLAHQRPRDDAFVVRSVGPWLAVAVADGVGSRPLSRYGATYTVESLTTLLLRPFAPSLKEEKVPDDVPEPKPSDLKMRRKSSEELLASMGAWFKALGSGSGPSLPQAWSSKDVRQAGSFGWWPTPSLLHVADEQPQPEQTLPQSSPETPAPDQREERLDQASISDEPNLLNMMRQAFVNTHIGLRQHAENLKLELADLGCTALALLFNTETGRGAVGQVGDGALLGLTSRSKVEELVRPLETDDPQSVYTITRRNFDAYLALDIIERPPVDPFVAFYIMTDGVSTDLMYSPRPEELDIWAQGIDQNLRAYASASQAAADMMNWLATYQVKGSWDDRTLVVIMQRERTDGDRQPVAGQPESAAATDNQ